MDIAGTAKKAPLLFFFLLVSPLFAQDIPGSLAAGIARLETSAGARTLPAGERYGAFMELARLQRLSGDTGAALEAYAGALAVSPGDPRALLEQGRLLISLGSYEKAGAVLRILLSKGLDPETRAEARYLDAQLEAFGNGRTGALAALADDPEFEGYRGRIYYTLWKLTGLDSWKTRLSAEFPRAPEAGIASGSVDSVAAPLWLLFPGRDSLTLSAPAVSVPAPEARTALPPRDASPSRAGAAGFVLQTGLFGRKENAEAMAERLRKAGFTPELTVRGSGGNGLWAVSVSGTGDMQPWILKLKEAGFESFPVF